MLLLLLFVLESGVDRDNVSHAESKVLGPESSRGLHLASKSLPSCLALRIMDSSMPYSRAVSSA